MYFGKIIPGTAAYWRHKKAELYSWINHHVEHGRGAPSIFLTLSCAEFFWPDLRRLLQEFVFQTLRKKVDLEKDFRLLNQLLNDFSLIVQDYFHKRVEAFLEHICKKIFGIKHFWGRMEFSKLRGQIHIHLVGIIEGATRPGGIQHQMFIHKGDVMKQTKILAEWARKTFNLSAEIDENLINNAVAKHEKTKESPCSKRLSECTDLQMDCAELCSFCQMHSCSDYCLRTSGKNVKKRTCRMGCGDECPAYSKKTPGWTLSLEDAIIKDKRGFQKLNLKRNHPRFLQTSFYCLQSWRANCDVSIMIFDSDPKHPDLSEIAEVTDYVVSYACKGNVSYALEKEQIKDFTMCELARLPSVICSEIIETVSLSGYTKLSNGCFNESRTMLNKYKNRKTNLNQSLHQFFHSTKNVSKRQKKEYVPHYVGGSGQPIYPITENYARIELTKHKPWCSTHCLPSQEQMIEEFDRFLIDPECPTTVKLSFERAKLKTKILLKPWLYQTI